MEKGFNDDELADIMNEIESLEKEFSPEALPESKKEIEAKDAPQEDSTDSKVDVEKFEEEVGKEQENQKDLQSSIDEDVNGVLEELAEKPEEESVPVQKQAPEVGPAKESSDWDNVKPLRSTRSPDKSHSKMSFHVEGDMQLEMNFSIGESEVSLSISEDEGFCITMESGARFTLPLESLKKGHNDKAA